MMKIVSIYHHWRQQWSNVVMMDTEPVLPGAMLTTVVVPLSKELCNADCLFQSAVQTVCLPHQYIVQCDSSGLSQRSTQDMGRYEAKNIKKILIQNDR